MTISLPSPLLHFFALAGGIFLLRALFQFLWGVWITFLRPAKNLKEYGSWAVVTGATDGIGKGFVKALAKKKINVVLISRSEEKLAALSAEIESKFGIQTKTIAVDFTDPEIDAKISLIEKTVSDIDVGILINNVGLSYPYAQFFHELDYNLMMNLIRVNVEATTKMTRVIIPFMLAKKKGAIINIGSGAATVLPSDPLYAVYAGTKGYIDQFSRTLDVEYKTKGIDVQCQAPLYVATKLSKIRFASITCPSPDAYARCGLNWIGYESRCTPYWVHAIMWWLVRNLPEFVMDKVRLGQNLAIRKRGLAKEARKKEN